MKLNKIKIWSSQPPPADEPKWYLVNEYEMVGGKLELTDRTQSWTDIEAWRRRLLKEMAAHGDIGMPIMTVHWEDTV